MKTPVTIYSSPRTAKYKQVFTSVLGETSEAFYIRFSGSWLKAKCTLVEEESRDVYRGYIPKNDPCLLIFDETFSPLENAYFHGVDARVAGIWREYYHVTVWDPGLAPMMKDPVVKGRERCEGWVHREDQNLVFRHDGLIMICGKQYGAVLNGYEVTLFNEDDGHYYLYSRGESFKDIATHSYDMGNNKYRCRIPKSEVYSLRRISCWDGKKWLPIKEYERRYSQEKGDKGHVDAQEE